MPKKGKYYINKITLMNEIIRVKNTYCSFKADYYQSYDQVINEMSEITEPDTIYRFPTYAHIPLRDPPKKKIVRESDKYVKLKFPPFMHFILESKQVKCVAKSHWQHGLITGSFNQDHGFISEDLAKMYLLLAQKMKSRPNFSGYDDDMTMHGVEKLLVSGLTFDETRSENPFGYYSTMLWNAYVAWINKQNSQKKIRDKLMMMDGLDPSFHTQITHELETECIKNQVADDAHKIEFENDK